MTYDTYKESNIKWIGKIPSHWTVHRIKDYLDFKIGGTPPTKNNEYFEGNNIWVSIADLNSIDGDYIYDSSTKITDDGIRVSNVKKINKGSLLYSFKLSVGCIAFAGCDLYTNEAIAAFEPNKYVDLNYLKYIFKVDFENNANENIYGAKLFNSDTIKFSKFILPPLNEQKQIANYLDKKTSKIDTTIAKNKELIQLLEEKRTALINQKIINIPFDSVKLKDVLKIGGYIRGPFGSSLKREELKYDGIPVYEQQHAIHDSRDFRYYIDEDKYKELIRFKTMPNDLIISCSGTIGKVSIIGEEDPEGIISQALLILRINKNIILPEFLKYFLTSHKGNDYLVSESSGSAQVNISQKDVINKIPIKLPPINIQKEMVLELETINTKINKTIQKVNENIRLLEEYKTSLIHHVVTGKIDVRGEEI